jgi:hypothetical protein
MILLGVGKSVIKKKIAIHIPNSKVHREYIQMFPYLELSRDFDLILIFGKDEYETDLNYLRIFLPNILRSFHALIHYCLLWYRKFTSLSYLLRSYQYFGIRNQRSMTTSWLGHNGKNRVIFVRFLIYIFGNYLGLKLLHGLFRFLINFHKFNHLLNDEIWCVVLPYGGGISLEFDSLVYLCRKKNIKTIAIQENWDNVSSKSFLLEHPSHFLTWSVQSSSHLRVLQNFKGLTSEIGSLRLNCFFRKRDDLLANDLRPATNLTFRQKQHQKYILVIGTGSANHDYSVLKTVLRCSLFDDSTEYKLIYRPHPYTQISIDDLNKIQKLDNLTIKTPLKNEENEFRMNLVAGASFVISLYSTMILEASILNIPAIIPSFVVKDVAYGTEFFIDDFSHYSGMSTFGNILNAKSEQEFLDFLSTDQIYPLNDYSHLNWFCRDIDTKKSIIETISKLHSVST